MAQYASSENERERAVALTDSIANPVPLGLSAFAFTTAILGCSYAGFIVPSLRSGMSIAVGAALFYGGIVQILAGMWEFRKGSTIAATVFSSYGGFLAAFGLLFLPGFGILNTLSVEGFSSALGLFYLCWTIFAGVLFLGALRSNIGFLVVLGLLFLAFLALTIGELTDRNVVLLIIGGWIAVASALVAWYAALASMINTANGPFKLPVGWIR